MLFGKKKEKQEIVVSDMMCQHCVKSVKEALEKSGAKDVSIDLDSKKVSFTGDLEKGRQAVVDAGYKVSD